MLFPISWLALTLISKILAFFNAVSKWLRTIFSESLGNLFRTMSKIVVDFESLSSNIRKVLVNLPSQQIFTEIICWVPLGCEGEQFLVLDGKMKSESVVKGLTSCAYYYLSLSQDFNNC